MKKGKTVYLWFIILFFIVLWVPYFQNIAKPVPIAFFGGTPPFLSLYPWLLMCGMVEGALVLLYIKSLVEDIKKDEPKKFNL